MIKLIQILSEIKNLSGSRPFFLGYKREGSNRISLLTDNPNYLDIHGEAIEKNGYVYIKAPFALHKLESKLKNAHIPISLIQIEEKPGYVMMRVPSKFVKIKEIYPSKQKLDKDKEVTPLNLKIGKYDIDKGQSGYIFSWNEGQRYLNVSTLRRFREVYDILGITPETIYISSHTGLPSSYCLGHYNDEPIICAQRQTENPMAGQFYIYSKYARLSATHPENGKLPTSNTTKDELVRSLKLPMANNI